VATFANCFSGLALAKLNAELTFELADYRLSKLIFWLAVPTTANSAVQNLFKIGHLCPLSTLHELCQRELFFSLILCYYDGFMNNK